MECEKLRRRPVYYSAIVMIIVWFIVIIYITLPKIDAEHAKGLIQIEGMFSPWETIKNKEGKAIGSQRFNALIKRKLIHESPHKNSRNEYKEIKFGTYLSSKRKNIILNNWWYNQRDIHSLNTKRKMNGILEKRTNTDILKLHLIKKMRQKIIEKYAVNMTYFVNNSTYIKVLNWIAFASPNTSIFMDNLPITKPRKTTSAVHSTTNNFSLSYDWIPNDDLPFSNKTDMGSTPINLKTGLKYNVTEEEKEVGNIHNATTFSHTENQKTNKIDVTANKSKGNTVNKTEISMQPVVNSTTFELSLYEKKLLMTFSNPGSKYIDTTSEQNVKNEIGPISQYIDQVLEHEMKEDENTRSKYDYYHINNYNESPPRKKRKRKSYRNTFNNDHTEETLSTTESILSDPPITNITLIEATTGEENLSKTTDDKVSGILKHRLLESTMVEDKLNKPVENVHISPSSRNTNLINLY